MSRNKVYSFPRGPKAYVYIFSSVFLHSTIVEKKCCSAGKIQETDMVLVLFMRGILHKHCAICLSNAEAKFVVLFLHHIARGEVKLKQAYSAR